MPHRQRRCRETVFGSDVLDERSERPMKYMLLMNFPSGKWNTEGIWAWPPEDANAHIAWLRRFNEELRRNGEDVTAQGLAGADDARIVRARNDGPPEGTDG